MKIASAPICACKNNRRIWRHNASAPPLRDVTVQLWWRHNAGSEKTLATVAKSAIDNCFYRIVCSGHEIACKKWNNTFITVNNDIFVTLNKNSLFTVTHALFFISLLKIQNCFTLSLLLREVTYLHFWEPHTFYHDTMKSLSYGTLHWKTPDPGPVLSSLRALDNPRKPLGEVNANWICSQVVVLLKSLRQQGTEVFHN